MQIKLTEKGVSLVEALISIASLGGLLLGIMKLNDTLMLFEQRQKVTIQSYDVARLVRSYMEIGDVCSLNLRRAFMPRNFAASLISSNFFNLTPGLRSYGNLYTLKYGDGLNQRFVEVGTPHTQEFFMAKQPFYAKLSKIEYLVTDDINWDVPSSSSSTSNKTVEFEVKLNLEFAFCKNFKRYTYLTDTPVTGDLGCSPEDYAFTTRSITLRAISDYFDRGKVGLNMRCKDFSSSEHVEREVEAQVFNTMRKKMCLQFGLKEDCTIDCPTGTSRLKMDMVYVWDNYDFDEDGDTDRGDLKPTFTCVVQ